MSDRRPSRRSRLAIAALALLAVASATAGAEKVLVYALEGGPESLDFAKAGLTERSLRVAWLLCDTLVNVSRDGQGLEGGLAESWTLSPDGLRAVVKLRPGALFHDGTSIDAPSVKAGFDRQFRSAHALYSAEPKNVKEPMLRELVEDIQVQDRLTLGFTLKYPGFHYLSQVEVMSPTAIARLGQAFARNPVCSGPFRFEGWTADRITVTAFDRYWAGRPRIDRVVFRFIADGKVAVDSLLAGEVDFVPVLPDPTFFERVRESPRVKLLPVSGLNVFYVGFYTERPPFNNPRLRRAVVQAINVPRTALFLGRGAAVAAKGPLPPAMKGHDPTVSQPSHDPPAARTLLGEGGHDAPLSVRLVHNSAVAFVSELAGAIQSDLRRVGVQVRLVGKPTWLDVVSAVRAREGDMYVYSWHVRAPNPERLLVPLFHSRSLGSTNLTHYKNPALDRLLDEAARIPEGPEQTRFYAQAQKLIVEDAPMVFLFHTVRMAGYADRVQGLQLNLGSLPHDKLVTVDLVP